MAQLAEMAPAITGRHNPRAAAGADAGGAARNALDSALWDLGAALHGQSLWQAAAALGPAHIRMVKLAHENAW